MFTEVWLDNAINKIVYIPKSLVHVLKMKNEISAAKYSKKRSYSSPPPVAVLVVGITVRKQREEIMFEVGIAFELVIGFA